MAEKLNEFYTESIKDLVNLIPHNNNCDFTELIVNNKDKFSFQPVNISNIRKILEKIKIKIQ
jgi:hypothetical protein